MIIVTVNMPDDQQLPPSLTSSQDVIVSNEFRMGSRVDVSAVIRFVRRMNSDQEHKSNHGEEPLTVGNQTHHPIHLRFGYRTQFESGVIETILEHIILPKKDQVHLLDLMWNPFQHDFVRLLKAATHQSPLSDLRIHLQSAYDAQQLFSSISADNKIQCLGLCLKCPPALDANHDIKSFPNSVGQGIQQIFPHLKELRLHLFDFTDEALELLIRQIKNIINTKQIQQLWFVTEGILSPQSLPQITQLLETAAQRQTAIFHLGMTFSNNLFREQQHSAEFVNSIQIRPPSRLILSHVGLHPHTVSSLLAVYAKAKVKAKSSWLHLRGRGFLQGSTFATMLRYIPHLKIDSLVVEDSTLVWTTERENLFMSVISKNIWLRFGGTHYRNIPERVKTCVLQVEKRNHVMARIQAFLEQECALSVWPRLIRAAAVDTSSADTGSTASSVFLILQQTMPTILKSSVSRSQ